MLMLSRNTGKSIVIGGNIRVTVASVNGQQVRLGIVAPAGVVVDREEIHLRRVAEGTADQGVIVSASEGDLPAKLVEREAQLAEADILLRESIAFINEYQGSAEFRERLIARIDKLLDRDKEPHPEQQP